MWGLGDGGAGKVRVYVHKINDGGNQHLLLSVQQPIYHLGDILLGFDAIDDRACDRQD